MGKFRFTLFLFFCILVPTTAQDYAKEFGKISKEELELKKYGSDTNAEAVVLFDMGQSFFVPTSNSFDVVFERTTRIKIFTDAGIKWADVEIPFYHEGEIYEKTYDVEAYAYNYENGEFRKTKFNVSEMYNEMLNNFWSVKKFAIPDVKAGTIIEYTYKINSQYKFNLRDWEFQWKIPVVYSEYIVKMIPYYEYSWLLQGAKKFDVSESYQDKGIPKRIGFAGAASTGDNVYYDLVHKFGMKNVAAFKDEEFITSINDYILKIDFQLSKFTYLDGRSVNIITTWEEMIDDLLKLDEFGNYLVRAEKIAPSCINIKSLVGKTNKEKFDIVLNYVKSNYSWDKNEGKYATKTPGKFVEEKVGNDADINLFTVGLLNSVGIEAYPLLISTRENGKIKYDYPYSQFFDYVLVAATVDEKKIVTDATELLCLNDRIPERCINDKGIVIKKGVTEWINLECVIPSEIHTEIEMDFNQDMDMVAHLKKTYTEYDALSYRNMYADKNGHLKDQLESREYKLRDSTLTVQNQAEKENPYILTYTLTGLPEIVNEKIYVQPFLNESISENPLKQITRNYPIDMTYPRKRQFISTINVPEGYHVEFTPPDYKLNNQLFELNFSILQEGKTIVASFDYGLKKSLYQATDYGSMKYFYNEIVKKGNEKIVFSK